MKMKKNTTTHLFTPYELFGQEIGKGWLPLVEPILNRINELNKQGANITITQVKEKWGELCVYLSSYTPELEEMIDEATRKSVTICENCGKPAQRVWGNYGWIYTLCPDCLAARKIKVTGPVEVRTIRSGISPHQ